MISFNVCFLVLNYNCNNRCTWCYAKENLESSPKNMPLKLAKNSIDLSKKLNVRLVTLIGGEPTLYPNLKDIIKYAKNKGVKIGMVTNGRKLKDEDFVRMLVDSGLHSITISIEGSTPEIHDKITKVNGSFYETMEGIKNILKEKIQVSTETTICKENSNNLFDILDMVYKIGVKNPGINICSNFANSDTDSMVDIKTCAEIGEKMYVHAKSKKKQIRFITPIPFCAYRKDIREEMINKRSIRGKCQVHVGSSFVIDYNGDILPCVRFSGYSLGNIITNNGNLKIMTKEEFIDFWENREPKIFRDTLWRFPSRKCQIDKKYWGVCVGGCPILWFTFDPEKQIVGVKS